MAILLLALATSACQHGTNQSDRTARLALVDSSIQATGDMFGRAGLTMGQPDVIMSLFILRDHFKLSFDFPTIPDFYEKRPYLTDRYFKLYDRYFDGKFYVNFSDEEVWAFLESDLERNLNALTFWSMYCEKFPFNDRFLTTIELRLKDPLPYPDLNDPNVPPQEYWSLHAALQIQNGLNGGCLTRTPRVDRILSDLESRLAGIMNKEQIRTKAFDQDIWLESIVMLYYLGMDEKVPESMIDELLSKQLNGGGYSYGSTSDKVSLHSSMLAMWALLEYRESLVES